MSTPDYRGPVGFREPPDESLSMLLSMDLGALSAGQRDLLLRDIHSKALDSQSDEVDFVALLDQHNPKQVSRQIEKRLSPRRGSGRLPRIEAAARWLAGCFSHGVWLAIGVFLYLVIVWLVLPPNWRFTLTVIAAVAGAFAGLKGWASTENFYRRRISSLCWAGLGGLSWDVFAQIQLDGKELGRVAIRNPASNVVALVWLCAVVVFVIADVRERDSTGYVATTKIHRAEPFTDRRCAVVRSAEVIRPGGSRSQSRSIR